MAITTKTTLKFLFSALFVFILFTIIVLYIFIKPISEYGLRIAGFPDSQIGHISFGLKGTTIRKISLGSGISIDEMKIYATLSDLLHARLGQVIVSGAKVDASEKDNNKNNKIIILPINLHVNTVEITQAEILVPTPFGDLNITTKGSIVDRGETYQSNLMFDGQADFGKTSGQLTASLQKQSGDVKIHMDLAETKLTTENLDIKRTSGWVESDFNLNMKKTPAISAQITTGAVRIYDIPLQGTTLTASTTDGKTQILMQGQAQKQSGSLALDLLIETDKMALSLDAALQNLAALEISGLQGQGAINLSLVAEKDKNAGWVNLDKLLNIKGQLSVSSKKLSIPNLMSDVNISAQTAVVLEPKTKQIALDISEVNFNSSQLSFSGKPSQLKIFATESPALSGKLEFQDVTIGEKGATQLVVPVNLSLQFSPPGNDEFITRISGNIKEKNGLLYVKLDGNHDSKLQKGMLKIDMPPLNFIKGVTSAGDIFPFIKSRITESSGTAGLSSLITWEQQKSGWGTTAEATMLLKKFSALFDGYPVNDVNTVLHLDSLLPLTFTRQSVFIGALDAGLPLTNGVLQISLDPGRNVTFHQGQWNLANGSLSVAPFTVNLDEKSADITLTATGLDLPELFRIAPLEGLDATGRVNGVLPLLLRNGQISLVGGVLETEGRGAIRYNPKEIPAFLQDSSQKQIVDLRVALKAFDFEALRMTLDGELGKNQKISLHAKGKNPEFYEGYPVNINLTVEGPLQSVLKYTPGGSQIPDSIKQQIESFEKQHAVQ